MFLRTYLDIPGPLPESVKSELVSDFSGIHGIRQILLVCEDQEEGVSEFILVQHALQLLSGLNNTIAIIAVDNEDDALGVLEVMPPQRSNLVLTADVPYSE